jgi:ferredoxin-NADP reductase
LIDGQWKVDYNKTMVSLIGFDPNELMQGMKEGLEGMGEAMGEAMKEGFEAMKETTTDTHTEASWKSIKFSDLVHYKNRFVRMENRRGMVREGTLTAFSNGTASILKGRPSHGLTFQLRSQDIVKIEVFD